MNKENTNYILRTGGIMIIMGFFVLFILSLPETPIGIEVNIFVIILFSISFILFIFGVILCIIDESISQNKPSKLNKSEIEK